MSYGLYTHIQSNKRRSVALIIGLFFLVYLLTFAGALVAGVALRRPARQKRRQPFARVRPQVAAQQSVGEERHHLVGLDDAVLAQRLQRIDGDGERHHRRGGRLTTPSAQARENCCRARSVAALIQARPPSQPLTLGGARSCWPIDSRGARSASGRPGGSGTPSASRYRAAYSTGM